MAFYFLLLAVVKQMDGLGNIFYEIPKVPERNRGKGDVMELG